MRQSLVPQLLDERYHIMEQPVIADIELGTKSLEDAPQVAMLLDQLPGPRTNLVEPEILASPEAEDHRLAIELTEYGVGIE